MKKNIMIALLLTIGLGQIAPVMAMRSQGFPSGKCQFDDDHSQSQESKTNGEIIRAYVSSDYDTLSRKFMVAMCNKEALSCFKEFFKLKAESGLYGSNILSVEQKFKEQFCDHYSSSLKQDIMDKLLEEDLQIYLDCHNVEDFKYMIINDLQNFFLKKQADYVYFSLRNGFLCNSVGEYIQSKLSSDSKNLKKIIFESIKLSPEKFIMDCLEQKKVIYLIMQMIQDI